MSSSGTRSAKSARASTVSVIEELITLTGSIDGIETARPMLVDSGATSNFVDAEFVTSNRIQTTALPRSLSVRMANGEAVPCELMVKDANVRVPGHRGEHDMLVLPTLDGCDAILGRPFLVKSNACVRHAESVVEFEGKHVQLASNQGSSSVVAMASAEHTACCVEAVVGADEKKSVASGCSERVRGARAVDACAGEVAAIAQVLHDVESVDVSVQDGILRLLGMTVVPEPAEDPVPMPQVSAECRAAIDEAIASYEQCMEQHRGQLPPSRGEFDHQINLIDPNVQPRRRKAIPLSDSAQKELWTKLQELQEAGLIRPSRSDWAAPVFMVPKADGGSRMVCDYRQLNEEIEKDASSLPHIKELLNRVGKACVFTKLDLKSGYHQVRVRAEDIAKTAFITPHGHFEWLVMPFGETNAPATFSRLMSQLVLREYVHSFVIVFQDDILIASAGEAEHVVHVQKVLSCLQQHQLWIQPSKCAWGQREVDFLGHKIRATSEGTVISTMDNKIDAIRDWPLPRTVSELRRFLGLCNYYRTFVRDHSKVAAPLTAMTAGDRRGRSRLYWTELGMNAFEQLKRCLCEAPVLVVADDEKPFVIHVDACSFAIGAVLSQLDSCGQLRPVAFFSQKLTDTQLRWATYERELWAMVAALQHWDWHLRSSRHMIEIHSDHRSLECLMLQETWTPKQSRWALVLAQYKFSINFVPGELNVVADALSRRSDHDEGSLRRRQVQTDIARRALIESGSILMPAVSSVAVTASSSLADTIRLGYERDQACAAILHDPEVHGYRESEGLLLRHRDFGVLVPDFDDLRRRLIREAHDKPVGGHLGVDKTATRLAEVYYWPGSRADVARFVAACPSCQRNKPVNARPGGLLKPLPIVPKGHTVSMDFIGPLPKTPRGYDSLLVMVDKFSKRAWFEPVRTTITAKQTAEVVLRRVVRDQLLPAAILTDRDPRFTSKVWSELWSAYGTDLMLSTAFHSQTDGQTERLNRTLEEMLRSYVNERGTDWDQRLLMAEISYNTAVNAATGFTPMRLHIGVEGRSPLHLAVGAVDESVSLGAKIMLQRMTEDAKVAEDSMKKAQERMKKYYDMRHRHIEYKVGDKALIDGRHLFTSLEGRQKLRPRFAGPFTVTEVTQGGLNVRLDLPKSMKNHPVFHVQRLRRWVEGDRLVEEENAIYDDMNWLGEDGDPHRTSPSIGQQRRVQCQQPHESRVAPREDDDDDGDQLLEYGWLGAFDGDQGILDDGSISNDEDLSAMSEAEEQQVVVAEELLDQTIPATRSSGRNRRPPDRFMHQGRLADELGVHPARSRAADRNE